MRRIRSAISKRLLGRRLGQEDGELLPAEARGDVVVAQDAAERLGDAEQHGVSREVAVRVVDLAQEIEVDHDHRHRTAEPLRARELLTQLGGEVTGVEEPRLRVDARLLLEGGHVQRPVDEDERRDRGDDQPAVGEPEGRERHAEEREDQIRGEALEREEIALAQRRAVGDVHHRREQDVVRQDEDDAGDEPRERPLLRRR